MALYLGSGKKFKIQSHNGGIYRTQINIPTSSPVVNENRLLSLEGYILTDIHGLYLTAKEVE